MKSRGQFTRAAVGWTGRAAVVLLDVRAQDVIPRAELLTRYSLGQVSDLGAQGDLGLRGVGQRNPNSSSDSIHVNFNQTSDQALDDSRLNFSKKN